MILGIPVVDGHELTENLLESLEQTVADPAHFTAVIIDNASSEPYEWSKYRRFPFKVDVKRYDMNKGYYYPLLDLALDYADDAVGLIHNDMLLYAHGWDVRMQRAFDTDPKLGLIGLCGSNEIDDRGGRGNGTMCNFQGRQIMVGDKQYTGQSPSAGLRIGGLQPAVVLDSLFMMFRRDVVPSLHNDVDKWEELPLAHFYDRIWPCRVLEAGFRVAVAGEDCDHLGGMTTTANQRYADDCVAWLTEHNYPFDNPETEMYLLAERRFLGEYRETKHFIPLRVGRDYEISR
jgi:hypothetical protein